jgi:tetratricopeptide (TPR) repeat protein
LVAGHFEQAGRAAEAAEWYGRAGQQARAGYEPAMAVEYFSKALSLCPASAYTDSSIQRDASSVDSKAIQDDSGPREADRKRLAWVEGLADGLGHQARFAEAIGAVGQMREFAIRLGDALAQARVWNQLAYLEERRGDNRASVAAAEQAEQIARGAGESGRREQIRALYLKGWALYRLADWQPVLTLASQTEALCTECNDRPGLANSCKLHGVVHLQYGHYEEADRYFQKGLGLCLECGDRRNAAAMWNNLGESARLRGDCATAVGFYQRALTIARQIGHRESETIYLSNLSGARIGLGEFNEAEAGLREALKLSSTPNSGFVSEALSFLAVACLGQGRIDDALHASYRALTLARETENELDYAVAWRVLGLVTSRLEGNEFAQKLDMFPDLASTTPETCFAESLRLFKKINADAEQARTLRAWAELHSRHSQREAAAEKYREARTIFERLGMAAEIERTPGATVTSFTI